MCIRRQYISILTCLTYTACSKASSDTNKKDETKLCAQVRHLYMEWILKKVICSHNAD